MQSTEALTIDRYGTDWNGSAKPQQILTRTSKINSERKKVTMRRNKAYDHDDQGHLSTEHKFTDFSTSKCFRRFLNAETQGAEMTSLGGLFHTRTTRKGREL
ncbi:hypothetical protein Tcan_11402 [Toxocara canis]|uniref:Uncharacterized protein n=1 Tax=Toxocara canis TaxID=6265 RepID=A0A0B2VUN2_TOXCA|nr:hypothetical protein Tcan_11402 [Toxocara canis]